MTSKYEDVQKQLIENLRSGISDIDVFTSIPDLIKSIRSDSLSPDIFLIELASDDDKLFDMLDELANEIETSTPVFGFGTINDVEFYRKILSIGFKDYFVAPFDKEKVSKIIAGFQSTPDDTKRSIFGFIGLAGGVGTTTVAYNFSQYLSSIQHSPISLIAIQPPPYCSQPFYSEINSHHPESGKTIRFIPPSYANRDSADKLTSDDSVISVIDGEHDTASGLLIDIGTNLHRSDVLSICDHFVLIGEPDFKSLANVNSISNFLAVHYPFASRHLGLTRIELENRIEFGPDAFLERCGIKPLLFYRHDIEILTSALANTYPLLPHALLKNVNAFEVLARQCNIAVSHPTQIETIQSSYLNRFMGFLRRRMTPDGSGHA